MLYVDIQFANRLSTIGGIRNFRYLGRNVWRFSCPLCGDSKRRTSLARGFLFEKKNVIWYKCFNCGNPDHKTLRSLIKHLDGNLYKEYIFERFKTDRVTESKLEELEKEEPEPLRLESIPATKISDLGNDHKAFKYLLKRRISLEHIGRMYYVDNFKEFSNKLKPGVFKNINKDHPRIILPFYDQHGKIFAFQGRSLGKETPKYLTIKIDENAEKLFGLERLDTEKDFYVVEGPIDSLFLDNCIAVAGGAVNSSFLLKYMEKVTIIFDNEPRNPEICAQIEKCIRVGYKVCILPRRYRDVGKDINDLILGGISKKEVKRAIKENTWQGVMALAKFSQWRTLK